MYPLNFVSSLCDPMILCDSLQKASRAASWCSGTSQCQFLNSSRFDLCACMFYIFQLVASVTFMCAREVEMQQVKEKSQEGEIYQLLYEVVSHKHYWQKVLQTYNNIKGILLRPLWHTWKFCYGTAGQFSGPASIFTFTDVAWFLFKFLSLSLLNIANNV